MISNAMPTNLLDSQFIFPSINTIYPGDPSKLTSPISSKPDNKDPEVIPAPFSPLTPKYDEDDSDENIELESIQNRSPDCSLSPLLELLGQYFKEDSDEAEILNQN